MIKIYNRDMKPLAVLENAYKIGYERTFNELDSARFTLPIDDEKNSLCTPFNYVEIVEDGEPVDLYRIMPTSTRKSVELNEVSYECEHVLGTLIDDVIFGYFQRSNFTTREVIEDLLAFQTETRWVLGDCDFERRFHYGAEHENVLSVLFSIPRPFNEPYQWEWDTSSFPWVLHLREGSDEIVGEARWGKNVRGIERFVDSRPVATRIFPLGYGEGVNQLNIREVNPTGLPYIEADTVEEYGIINYIFVDRRFEDVEALYAAGQAKLDELKHPQVSYEVDAVDLRRLGHLDRFDVGKLVRIQDTDLGTVDVRVMRLTRPDITGEPWAIQLEIGNKRDNLAVSNVDLERRQQVNDTYAQGATNIDSHSYQDNADPEHPAIIRFYLDEGLVNVNSMLLSLWIESFRAYSRAIEGGGALVSSTEAGGAVVKSTSSGGGSTQTSTSGGGVATSTQSGGGVSTSTQSGGGATETSSAGGDHRHRMFSGTGFDRALPETGTAMLRMRCFNNAYFYVPEGMGAIEYYTEESSGNHSHSVTVPAHAHDFSTPAHSHEFTIPSHSHDVTIPSHTHEIDIPEHSHEIELPDHTHDIEHGIFVLDRTPTAVEIRVDGNLVPHTAITGNDIDIVPYLAKDSNGKVTRGAWHEVSITPNDLGRVTADVVSRLFIQSREGGVY